MDRSIDVLLRNPITGIAACCPRAANGQATAALPRNKMNSRRFIARPCMPIPILRAVHQNRKVHGAKQVGGAAMCAAAIPSGLCPSRVNSTHYRNATTTTGSAQSADIRDKAELSVSGLSRPQSQDHYRMLRLPFGSRMSKASDES